jgi:hypothetical protein
MSDRRKYLTAKKREQRERARTAGLCIICAKTPANTGRVTCSNCRDAVVNNRKQRSELAARLATVKVPESEVGSGSAVGAELFK